MMVDFLCQVCGNWIHPIDWPITFVCHNCKLFTIVADTITVEQNCVEVKTRIVNSWEGFGDASEQEKR